MKNRKAVWVQNGTLVVYPHHPMAAWELWFAATAQHQEKISYCLVSLGKEQIPKFKVRFLLNVYYFCTRVKSNDSKSGNVCIQPEQWNNRAQSESYCNYTGEKSWQFGE